MRNSSIGGGRRTRHPSNSTATPTIGFIVLLCIYQLSATASSTRSPRSCHLVVAGVRAALPASMISGPAALAGSVDSAGTPQQPTPREVKPPHRVGKAAALRRSTDQHELPWLGSAVPSASSTPSTSSGSGGIRQSDGLLRVARRRRFHVTLGAIGSRQDHEARITLLEASRRRARSPRHGGMTSAIATGSAATDLVIASELARPSRVPSATSRRHVELSRTRTSSWAGMRVLPARRQVAGVPHWHAQRLLTQRRGDTAMAPALGASAQGVHTAPLGFLVLKTLNEATAPCSLVSFASSRGHGPFGCPGRQCPLRWPACLGVGSL